MASDSAQREFEARRRIGEHLRALRKAGRRAAGTVKGWTQEECGARAGVTRWVWCSWEHGTRSIPAENIARAYAAVGVDIAAAIPTLRAA